MLHTLPHAMANAALPRLVLLVNHVLAAEPAATQRLARHGGRTARLTLRGWPELLPAVPALRFGVTPAGLLEWLPADEVVGDAAAPASDLEITVDAANPARLLIQAALGQRPAVNVAGDAAFAADVSWVIDNVRWDLRDDLARLFGELPAGEIARQMRAVAQALRTAAQGLAQRAATAGGAAFGGTAGGASPPQPPAR